MSENLSKSKLKNVFCENMQVKGYGPLTLIDGGGFSSVYKAENLSLHRTFAIKVLNPTSKSAESNVSSYREMQALSVADHQNIVKLHEVVQSSASICLVQEYLPYNLSKVTQNFALPESLAKGFMLMLLRGLAHLHELGIIHRDIKPQNLLMSNSGVLKICDLGLCRILPEKMPNQGCISKQSDIDSNNNNHAWTLQVGTHYYRAPELLSGDRGYTEAIDLWAAGCVMAELLNGEPLFPGVGDLELIGKISELLGSPCEETWPGISQMPDYGKLMFKQRARVDMRANFPSWSENALDLFEKFIIYEPGKRISAREALHHPWFSVEPTPIVAPYDGKGFDLFRAVSI
ncbi:CMGC family protein kinase [Tritrichomonas foetus]|uniref:cyclin-dependent kinase n=1 Tax=Tritrichomonas foetus TaxID=1144522 RepID=A0A1J4K6P6_9EUKA|nr:CMGC family protein kinase [Tritrichomonas foetus]|eukprot:OHT07031.1 CMGC family protein kinase [Tritrichomonas foetus]